MKSVAIVYIRNIINFVKMKKTNKPIKQWKINEFENYPRELNNYGFSLRYKDYK